MHSMKSQWTTKYKMLYVRNKINKFLGFSTRSNLWTSLPWIRPTAIVRPRTRERLYWGFRHTSYKAVIPRIITQSAAAVATTTKAELSRRTADRFSWFEYIHQNIGDGRTASRGASARKYYSATPVTEMQSWYSSLSKLTSFQCSWNYSCRR